MSQMNAASDLDDLDDLVRRVAHSAGLPDGVARRVVDDVMAHFDESPQAFVVRRHGELARAGWKNADIYRRLSEEVARRPFAGPVCSARQIRRMIYG